MTDRLSSFGLLYVRFKNYIFLRKEEGWTGFPRSVRAASRDGWAGPMDITRAGGPTDIVGHVRPASASASGRLKKAIKYHPAH